MRTAPTTELADALDGATLVWLETPSNPGLDVCDIAAIATAAHASAPDADADATPARPKLPSNSPADVYRTSTAPGKRGPVEPAATIFPSASTAIPLTALKSSPKP